MSRSRLLGLIILLGSLAIGGFALARMAARVSEFNEHAHFGFFRFDLVSSRKFNVHGRPVSITDADDVRGNGRASFEITYGDTSKTVSVVEPPATDVPDLGIYGEWAKVVEVHELERSAGGSIQDKPDGARVVLICRIPPEGYDPATWGSVRRADWTFDIHEFKPDGTIETSTFRWPRSELGEMSLRKEIEKGEASAKVLATIPPLQEKTWQYHTAMHVIPPLNVPRYRFNNTAMKAMGWTLPAAGFSGLGVVIGIGLLIAPARVTAQK